MKNDDSELIQRTLDGDQQAFAQLVEKYQEQVHTLAWQKIGDFHIAQEITQDVFITAYQKFSTFTHYRQFAGWLYVVTNRKCIAWHRKHKIETQSIDETNPAELEEAYYSEYMTQQREDATKEKRRTIVHKLLSKLKESDRTVMSLYYLAEMPCEDIGKFLGISPNTVRSRLHRARNQLREEEAMIKDSLSSFQLPTQMTENIMKEILRLNPVTPIGSKPLVPFAVSAASAIIVFLLIGFGAQNLIRFQKPYSIEATSETTVELVDTDLFLDLKEEPDKRNQLGQSDEDGNINGVGNQEDDRTDAIVQAPPSDIVLSKESADLLEKITKEVIAYNGKLQSGKIDFQIKQNKYVPPKKEENVILRLIYYLLNKPVNEKAKYEEVGIYQITYTFQGRHHLYDVKFRRKMDFAGFPFPDWEEKHYQFQTDNKEMLIREKNEDGLWVQHPKPVDKTIFRYDYSPLSWGWHPSIFSFTFLTRNYYNPIKVEQVKVNQVPQYLITLQRIHGKDSSSIQQIWIDPAKGYRPTQSLKTSKRMSQAVHVGPDGKRIVLEPEEAIRRIKQTFNIAKFAPDIWFPKSATYGVGYDPEIEMSGQFFQMQVDKAEFNIPIPDKELRFSD